MKDSLIFKIPLLLRSRSVPVTFLRRFSYKDIKHATDNFSRVIGTSSHGASYKARFQNGRVAVVKEIHLVDQQDDDSFYREVQLLGRLHHRHIVALNGFSVGRKRFLVFENVENGSLKEHLNDPLKTPLDWRIRLKIAVGVAAALEYLHFFCDPPVYHVSISSSTIMLDENYNAKLSEWMTNRSYLDKSCGNIAVHLDLISRVYGLQQADKFFNTIPDASKDFKVYGTLLNCYAFNKSLEKAEATMEKMKQLGYMTTHSYHSMLNLYSKTRNHDKLLKLVEEMEKTGVRYNRTTYYILLSAYASFDINAMENLLGYMETNPDLTLDWHVYIIAAKGYLNFGQNEKSLEMLKKSEQSVRENTNAVAYEILLTMYANLALKDHVYRIWDLYKTTCRKVTNKMYHHMASSLVKLDENEGAEKILTEWESETASFDFWVVNVLVNGYSRKGDWKKAEEYIERLVGMGKQPPKSTWDCLATAYCKYEEMEKAVEAMKKAISCCDDHWSLNQVTLIACVKYLEKKGDMEVAKEFARLVKGRRVMESATDGNSTVGLVVNSSGHACSPNENINNV